MDIFIFSGKIKKSGTEREKIKILKRRNLSHITIRHSFILTTECSLLWPLVIPADVGKPDLLPAASLGSQKWLC